MSKVLKRGYTTGVHASFAFRSALEAFFSTSRLKSVSKTIKMDNDDLDVTKGCEIVVTISHNREDLKINKIDHHPYSLGSLKIYSGIGVGVVTKDGLKPPKNYPAINPTPLKSIEKIYNSFVNFKTDSIYMTISVTNGEEIAKNTSNGKVGVLGGISILGTSGFVKPVSASAYIDSIESELNVAKANGYDQVVLTLGNSSYLYAKENYAQMQIVEIGNFVYSSFEIVNKLQINSALFVCGLGKATKVMQGFKNTHNRFGTIDFISLRDMIKRELGVFVDIESTKTVKGISQQLQKIQKIDEFYKLICKGVDKRFKMWFDDIDIKTVIIR